MSFNFPKNWQQFVAANIADTLNVSEEQATVLLKEVIVTAIIKGIGDTSGQPDDDLMWEHIATIASNTLQEGGNFRLSASLAVDWESSQLGEMLDKAKILQATNRLVQQAAQVLLIYKDSLT